jgi:hypothetical protein
VIRNRPFFFGTPGRPGGVAATFHRASVRDRRFFATIQTTGSERKSPRTVLFAGFETGELRRPFFGQHFIAAPITGRPARPGINRAVDPQYRISSLHLTGFRGKKRVVIGRRRRGREQLLQAHGEFGVAQIDRVRADNVQFKGRLRTFVLKHSARAPFGGIFQRFGSGRGDIREIYAFIPPFKLDQRLHWLDTANAIAPQLLHENMRRQVVEAMVHDMQRAV